MKKYLSLVIVSCFLGFANLTFSQTNENNSNDTIRSYEITELDDIADFVGGYTEMSKFVTNNIVLPKIIDKNTNSGKVYVGFSVEKDGTLTNFKIIKGFHVDFDNEALRVVKLMPKWEPGKINDKPVKVKLIVIPISFNLN